jgi:hypothetical protein
LAATPDSDQAVIAPTPSTASIVIVTSLPGVAPPTILPATVIVSLTTKPVPPTGIFTAYITPILSTSTCALTPTPLVVQETFV